MNNKIETPLDLAQWNKQYQEKLLEIIKKSSPSFAERFELEIFGAGMLILTTLCCLVIIWGFRHL